MICRQCKLAILDKTRRIFCSPICTQRYNNATYSKKAKNPAYGPNKPPTRLAQWKAKKGLVARRKAAILAP